MLSREEDEGDRQGSVLEQEGQELLMVEAEVGNAGAEGEGEHHHTGNHYNLYVPICYHVNQDLRRMWSKLLINIYPDTPVPTLSWTS